MAVVVPDFVGLREVAAACVERLLVLVEEPEVEVDTAVLGTLEGARLHAGQPHPLDVASVNSTSRAGR